MNTELDRVVLESIDAEQRSPLHLIDFDQLARKRLDDPAFRAVIMAHIPELVANYMRTAVGVRGAKFARPASVIDLNPTPLQ